MSVGECLRCSAIITYEPGRKHECFVGKTPQVGDVWQPKQEGVVVHVIDVDAKTDSYVLLHDDGVLEKTYRMSLYRFWRTYKPLITIGSRWRGREDPDLAHGAWRAAPGLTAESNGTEIGPYTVSEFLRQYVIIEEAP